VVRLHGVVPSWPPDWIDHLPRCERTTTTNKPPSCSLVPIAMPQPSEGRACSDHVFRVPSTLAHTPTRFLTPAHNGARHAVRICVAVAGDQRVRGRHDPERRVLLCPMLVRHVRFVLHRSHCVRSAPPHPHALPHPHAQTPTSTPTPPSTALTTTTHHHEHKHKHPHNLHISTCTTTNTTTNPTHNHRSPRQLTTTTRLHHLQICIRFDTHRQTDTSALGSTATCRRLRRS
jgi:hypothetical protein